MGGSKKRELCVVCRGDITYYPILCYYPSLITYPKLIYSLNSNLSPK
jgi:hypothetical protein